MDLHFIKNIYILTDKTEIYSILSEQLTHEGFGVSFLKEKSSRIQKVIEMVPDFIIYDMDHNENDCVYILETLQKIDFTAAIPFIILGPPKKHNEISDLKLIGVLDYIIKPFDISNLIISIKKEFSKRDFYEKAINDKLNIFLHNPFSGVIVIHEDRIIFSNKLFSTITGYLPEELYKLSLNDLVFSDDRAHMTELIRKHRRNNTAILQAKFRVVKKDNEIIRLNLWGYLFKENTINKLAAMVSICGLALNSGTPPKDMNNLQSLLSKREKEVLRLICQGYTSQEIAGIIFISERTVQGHRASLLEKTGCKNTASLIAFAIQLGYF